MKILRWRETDQDWRGIFSAPHLALSGHVDVLIYKLITFFYNCENFVDSCMTIAVCLYAFWTSIWTTWMRSGPLNIVCIFVLRQVGWKLWTYCFYGEVRSHPSHPPPRLAIDGVCLLPSLFVFPSFSPFAG
jgi:hypothetical protein